MTEQEIQQRAAIEAAIYGATFAAEMQRRGEAEDAVKMARFRVDQWRREMAYQEEVPCG